MKKPLDFLGIFASLTTLLARNDVGNDIRREIDVHPKHWDRFLEFKECVPTVNLIESVDNKVIGVTSFLDNPEGNRAAEAKFQELYKEHNDPDGTTGFVQPTDEDFAAMIEDGVYDDDCGYRLTITHSTQG